jgi:hypothetical protein
MSVVYRRSGQAEAFGKWGFLERCEVVAAMLPKVFKAHPCFPETAGIPGEGSLLYPSF